MIIYEFLKQTTMEFYIIFVNKYTKLYLFIH
jgi:hypothetical protein